MLQVEENGEAWYVYPDDLKKYYLGRPADAFGVMRELGLGATPEFITSHTLFPSHVLGKILIDVDDAIPGGLDGRGIFEHRSGVVAVQTAGAALSAAPISAPPWADGVTRSPEIEMTATPAVAARGESAAAIASRDAIVVPVAGSSV